MLIKVGEFAFTEVWDGVLYKTLSNYPQVSDWEIRTIIEFISYEEAHGRKCVIACENKALLETINEKIRDRSKYAKVPRPALITECTACPYRKGCETEFVCHTTSPEHAAAILEVGKLLSAVRARKIPAEQLMTERRNAAKDPADYFEYVMFAWGNFQAGDRLVVERKLGRFPNEDELSVHFTPGVRFYFRYDDLIRHPNVVFDGVLPMKIKDEIELQEYVYAIVIPSELRTMLEASIPDCLTQRVIYLEHAGENIWEWSEKVYKRVEAREKC